MSAPAVAVSANGKKFAVAWKDMRSGEPNIFWSIADGTDFGEESLLHANRDGKQDHPSICFDDTGLVWAVWEDENSGSQRICARSSQSEKIQVVSAENESPASFPVVTCGGGKVAVVYEVRAQNEKKIVFRVIDRTAAN